MYLKTTLPASEPANASFFGGVEKRREATHYNVRSFASGLSSVAVAKKEGKMAKVYKLWLEVTENAIKWNSFLGGWVFSPFLFCIAWKGNCGLVEWVIFSGDNISPSALTSSARE